MKQFAPAIFVGHGSPMNAIESNTFTEGFRNLAQSVDRPRAILCISAHWETYGAQLTGNEVLKTIHDFYGFPQTLYDVDYTVSGNPDLVQQILSKAAGDELVSSSAWGIDHGAWSVLIHMYPKADIPVIQLSLNRSWSPMEHYCFAKQLKYLQNEGVMIVGSGNIVHNLREIRWDQVNGGADWAVEANELIKQLILKDDIQSLAAYAKLGSAVQLSVPTPEHFLPLLYILALRDSRSELSFFNDSLVMGSLSMTSVLLQ